MSTALLHRLLHRRAAPPTTLRFDVRPPDLFPVRDSAWTLAWRWLTGQTADAAPARGTPLERARGEFLSAMTGLVNLDTNDLLRRAEHARSLRELWHLRSELYTLIARRVNQSEADARLARVNRHFPTRAQRTGILATEAGDAR